MPWSSGRVVKGGAAERSGCLHPGDEVLEVNGLRLKGKSVHDICSTLCQVRGTIQRERAERRDYTVQLLYYKDTKAFFANFFLLDTNIMPIRKPLSSRLPSPGRP